MKSKAMSIAKAVADALNTKAGATPSPFDFKFAAEARQVYVLDPSRPVSEGGVDPKVYYVRAVPTGTEYGPVIDRAGTQPKDPDVEIRVHKKLTSWQANGDYDPDELDSLTAFAEALAASVKPGTKYGPAVCTKVTHPALTVPEHLLAYGVFTSVIVCTFRYF